MPVCRSYFPLAACTNPLHPRRALVLPKLYTNSLMSSLNSRSGWKYGSGNDTTTDELNRTERGRHLNVRGGESGRRVSMMVRGVS